MSEAGCTEHGTKLTASSQTTLHCNFSGCDNIPLHIGHVSKSMTEMTCVGANAGSFLPHMIFQGAMVFI